MAATRKKQDEKNLKTLRELVSSQHNKHCFDCNQRGPTYVNVTVGSFVCTKCSGMLRGLTPPHRVKSISMATFTTEEIDLVKSRGNDYCRRVWLGLYEGALSHDSKDEQTVRDFMVDKYERKRYYLEPSQALQNGHRTVTTTKAPPAKPAFFEQKPSRVNGNVNDVRSRSEKNADFVADFSSADIFSSVNNNSSSSSFANFDNNPVFNSKTDDFSIFDINYTNNGPIFNQVPLFPKCNVNRNPPMTSFTNSNEQHQQSNSAPNPPPADRYAALKDLDNALKVQQTIDWNSSGSNGSLYSASTPAGSLYSSPSPQGSMFGSPSQGQFAAAFPTAQESNGFSNPFSNGGVWGNNNGGQQVNPFRNDESKVNGFNYSFQTAPVMNWPTWTQNPFKMSTASNGNSSNPFL